MEDHDDSISKLRVRTSPTFKKSDLVQEQQSPNEIKASITKRAGINVPLILSLFLNQFMMLTFASGLTAFYILFSGNGEQFLSEGILNWTGSWNGLQSADLDFSITPIRIMQGSLGAIPIIAFGNFIEKSDDRRFATTNFSTLYMIITLFGLRTRSQSDDKLKGEKFNVLDRLESMRSTIDVAFLSMGISCVTGFCEEIMFRGFIPHMLMSSISFQDPALACAGQASLFALGHTSPVTSSQENKIVASMQFVNGLWMGFLYLLTGGDIVPCIISHALYDFQVFFFSWLAANDQIEYSDKKCMEPIPPDSIAEVKKMKRQFRNSISDSTFDNCKKVFYLFDEDKNGFISRSEAQRGVSYLEAEGHLIAPSRKTVDSIFDTSIKMRDPHNTDLSEDISEQLRFVDFVRLYLTVKAASNAVVAAASPSNVV